MINRREEQKRGKERAKGERKEGSVVHPSSLSVARARFMLMKGFVVYDGRKGT